MFEKSNFKNRKAEKIILKKASEFIQKESNRQSLITVTNISTSKDFQNATIFVTVFPEHKEEAGIDFLKRNQKEFKNYIKKETRLNKIPHFEFQIDSGEKSRQRIEELL